jgi:hypothetical protein
MATTKTTANDDSFAAQQNWGQWTELFKQWQSSVFGDKQTPSADAYQHYFTKAGENFLTMIQQFYQSAGQSIPVNVMTDDWTKTLQKFFTNIFQSNNNSFDMSGWMSGDVSQWMAGFQNAGFDPMKFLTSIPGLGYNREKQEQANLLYKLWVDFDRTTKKYNAVMAKTGLEAVEKFQNYINNPPADAPPLQSLKAVYAKWVDICEDIYAKFAVSEEYIKLYGENVNALMAFKKQQNKMTDEMLEQLNIPTRPEIDSMHERMHMLRRDNIQLKKDVAALMAQLGTKNPAPSAPKPKTQAATAKPVKVTVKAQPKAKAAPKAAAKKIIQKAVKKPAPKKIIQKIQKKGKK